MVRMTVMCLKEFLEHKYMYVYVLAAIIIVINIIYFDTDL